MGRAAVVLVGGGRAVWTDERGIRVAVIPLAGDPESIAQRLDDGSKALGDELRMGAPPPPWDTGDEVACRALSASLGSVAPLAPPDRRRTLRLEASEGVREPARRDVVLALAQRRLQRALASPEETVVTLAREDARLERALLRERSARRPLEFGVAEPLRAHRADTDRFLERLAEHHARARRRLEAQVRSVAPNLAAIVGPVTAGRLIAAAGGLAPLGRATGARIQLLGAKRRPRGGRGPRFGVLYGADRMGEIPPARRGAYARSLAALAAVAARADLFTSSDVAPGLLARRERRIRGLGARR